MQRQQLDHLVFTTIRDLHCVLATDSTILRVSPSVVQLMGHSPDTLIGLPLQALVHFDDAYVFVDELQQAAANPGQRFRFHVRIRSAFPMPSHAAFEIHGHFAATYSSSLPGVFFLMARPAFLSNSTEIDLFLELKMEQEMLLRQLAELREGDADLHVAPNPAFTLSSGSAERFTDMAMGIQNSESRQKAMASVGPSSVLVQGDAGILYTPKAPSAAPKRGKAKVKIQDKTYLCTWCNTSKAPEWRNGPKGPKTLCNACGCT